MNTVFVCLSAHHDPVLVALAAVICTLGAYANYVLCRQACLAPSHRTRFGWGAAATWSTTATIWATHFIAMLAFQPGLPSAYTVQPTVASFCIAFVMVAAGVFVAVQTSSQLGQMLASLVIGLAVSAMHYTGMLAYHVPGQIVWDHQLISVSILCGVVLAMGAGIVSLGDKGQRRTFMPASLLVLAVCCDHFVGMSAISVVYDPQISMPTNNINPVVLSVVVADIALLIVGLTLAALHLHLKAVRRAAEEGQRLRDLADVAVEGLLICKGENIVSMNRSLERILPRRRKEYVGLPLDTVLPGLTLDIVPHDGEIETELCLGGGRRAPVRVIAQTLMFEGREHTVIAVRDQRERLRSEAAMQKIADTDALTDLPNRGRFNTVLAERCKARKTREQGFAFLALDLDRFKAVNDTFGHGTGDAVLIVVSERLQSLMGPDDLVARLGGDEFAILLAEMDADLVYALAERVIQTLSQPIAIDGNVHDVGVSVGVALAPLNGITPEELARKADLALYRAKEDGKGVVRMFEVDMDARMQARRHLEGALRKAMANGEFEVHYQPQTNAITGEFSGAEALVRWRHPEQGLIPPLEFIPLAETTGMISGIGEWVLRTACTDALSWPEHIRVAVNLSPVQFKDSRLAQMVADVLRETGLPGHRLELEVTESVLIQDEERTRVTLLQLRKLGIRISLDDFGTGYSSLSYLRRFPFDKIKIDRSFVQQTPADRESAAIVRAVVTLANSLGMTTTAEGVETEEQRMFVAAEGCTQIQGYLISRPVQACDLPAAFSPAQAAIAA